LETYQVLARYALELKCWDLWREKAFQHLRAEVSNSRAEFESRHAGQAVHRHRSAMRWAPRPPDHSLLVAALLWEEHEDEAWAEACEGGCDRSCWLDLARRREKKHPEDAVAIYRRQVAPLIEQTNNQSYEQAVEFLERIHALMKKSGTEGEFDDWLADLKTEYKRKRNFIKFVGRRAWGK
jgi:uncharacterized Zn finger protein